MTEGLSHTLPDILQPFAVEKQASTAHIVQDYKVRKGIAIPRVGCNVQGSHSYSDIPKFITETPETPMVNHPLLDLLICLVRCVWVAWLSKPMAAAAVQKDQ